MTDRRDGKKALMNSRRSTTIGLILGIALGVALSFAPPAIAARNAAGTYSLASGNPVTTGTQISSTWANNTLSDIATEITNSLDRTGKGAMTGQLQLANGTSSLPGLTFGSETSTGIYRAGSNDVRVQLAATTLQRFTPSTVYFTSNLVCSSATSSVPAIQATGGAAGSSGVQATGGADGGSGVYAVGGAPGSGVSYGGPGLTAIGYGGSALNGFPASFTSAAGVVAIGGSTPGAPGVGILAIGGDGGSGVIAFGSGAGAAFTGYGGPTSLFGAVVNGGNGTAQAVGLAVAPGTAPTETLRTLSIIASGDIKMDYTNPQGDAGSSPNVLTPANIVKSWAHLTLAAGAPTINSSYNVQSVTCAANTLTVTMARGFTGTNNYAVMANVTAGIVTTSPTSSTVFTITATDGAVPSVLNLCTAIGRADFIAIGWQ